MRKAIKTLVDVIEGNGSLADAMAKAKADLAPKAKGMEIIECRIKNVLDDTYQYVKALKLSEHFSLHGQFNGNPSDYESMRCVNVLTHTMSGCRVADVGKHKMADVLALVNKLEAMGDWSFSIDNQWAGWTKEAQRMAADAVREYNRTLR